MRRLILGLIVAVLLTVHLVRWALRTPADDLYDEIVNTPPPRNMVQLERCPKLEPGSLEGYSHFVIIEGDPPPVPADADGVVIAVGGYTGYGEILEAVQRPGVSTYPRVACVLLRPEADGPGFFPLPPIRSPDEAKAIAESTGLLGITVKITKLEELDVAITAQDYQCSDFDDLAQKLAILERNLPGLPVNLVLEADVPFKALVDATVACKRGYILLEHISLIPVATE